MAEVHALDVNPPEGGTPEVGMSEVPMKEALAARGAKVALVGLGYWGPNLLRSLVAMAGSEHVVVVDRAVDRVATACSRGATGCRPSTSTRSWTSIARTGGS